MASGAAFEELAANHLAGAGLTPLARNRRSRFGEIDLIMLERGTLVFVEVRYRKSAAFGGAIASVDAGKREKLAIAAAQFLQRTPKFARVPCRFDVVAISGEPPYRIEWLRDAFTL